MKPEIATSEACFNTFCFKKPQIVRLYSYNFPRLNVQLQLFHISKEIGPSDQCLLIHPWYMSKFSEMSNYVLKAQELNVRLSVHLGAFAQTEQSSFRAGLRMISPEVRDTERQTRTAPLSLFLPQEAGSCKGTRGTRHYPCCTVMVERQ